MSESLGDQIFVEPIVKTGTIWKGRVVDRGAKALKFSTFLECDKVTYSQDSIQGTTTYGSTTVHIVNFEDLTVVFPR